MGEHTDIGWTDHTFNPWWGCARVSPGCQNCYAEAFAKRTGHDVWGKGGERRFFGDKHWAEPVKWNRQSEHDATTGEGLGRRHRVFCASMADVFEDRDDLMTERARLWQLIEETPWLDWQLLTKRPESVVALAPAQWLAAWPENCWLGTTAEDQERADERLPHLLAVPGGVPVFFVSYEPGLGPVDLSAALSLDSSMNLYGVPGAKWVGAAPPLLDWVIAGGESGPGHRPFDPEWARSLRDQCVEAGVPFFFKQVGGRTPTAGGRLLDGRTHDEFPAEHGMGEK